MFRRNNCCRFNQHCIRRCGRGFDPRTGTEFSYNICCCRRDDWRQGQCNRHRGCNIPGLGQIDFDTTGNTQFWD